MSLPCDIANIAKCHQQSFANSFSTKLGVHYIAKSFEWFLSAPNKFLFHVEDDNKIAGYCGGFISQYIGDGSTSGMMQYAMGEAAKGIIKNPLLLFHKELIPFYPLIVKNIFKKLFHKKNNTKSFSSTPLEKKLGLVVIAVHPDYRGKGVFELLIKNFENEANLRNINKITLSVKRKNTRAINAYKKTGWLIDIANKNTINMYKILQ